MLRVASDGEEIGAESSAFWHNSFSLRKLQNGTLLCPALLDAVAEDILGAGKASLLLHAQLRYVT